MSDADFVPHQEECSGTEDDSEKWCYVNIRPGAHSFYWLYRSTHADGWQNRPLVMWLQVKGKKGKYESGGNERKRRARGNGEGKYREINV